MDLTMPSLLDLPPELIERVFFYLDQNSFFDARATCRRIERASLPIFGRRFFCKKGFLVVSQSLDVLSSISKHEDLRKCVRHLWFNPDLWSRYDPEGAEQSCRGAYREGHWTSSPEERPLPSTKEGQEYSLMSCWREHETLLYEQGLVSKFVEVFSALPNLETLGMRRSINYFPLGWERLKELTGKDPRVIGRSKSGPVFEVSSPTRLFIAIVRATSQSKIELKRLYTDIIELDRITASTLPENVFIRACHNIQWLEVNIAKGHFANRDNYDYNTLENTKCGARLVELLAATPNLRGLDLMMFPDLTSRSIIRSSERRPPSYNRMVFQNLSEQVRLKTLQRSKLEKASLSSINLTDLLTHCQASIQSVKLKDVCLEASSPHEERQWGMVFRFMAESCPGLNHILFHELKEPSGQVCFCENSNSTPGISNAPVNIFGGAITGEVTMLRTLDTVSLRAESVKEVKRTLQEVAVTYKNAGRVSSSSLEEHLWHTDTSDGED